MTGFSWHGGTKPLRGESRRERQDRQRRKEQYDRHVEKQAWNPNGVDPEPGFPVDVLAEDTLTGEWGEYTQVITVDPPDDTRLQWRGGVLVEDTG